MVWTYWIFYQIDWAQVPKLISSSPYVYKYAYIDQTSDMWSIYIDMHLILQNVHLILFMRCISMYQHFNINRQWIQNVKLNPPYGFYGYLLSFR